MLTIINPHPEQENHYTIRQQRKSGDGFIPDIKKWIPHAQIFTGLAPGFYLFIHALIYWIQPFCRCVQPGALQVSSAMNVDPAVQGAFFIEEGNERKWGMYHSDTHLFSKRNVRNAKRDSLNVNISSLGGGRYNRDSTSGWLLAACFMQQ